ncbi:MAG: phosphoribosylglycinamide formyltransferase [Gammaproteobacteria bacterium]|nr:phosphoribosylglycinamide formyltransferase [Gammaproteobacteria bacterium]
MTVARFPVVILISGRGTNLQAIVDEVRAGRLPIDIRAVISNNPDAAGLKQARAADLHTEVVDHRAYPARAAFEQTLAQAIDRHAPKLVVLAGFMRILGRGFIEHYRGRLINIHPSLLPKYPGLGTHARAIAADETQHGASVHFVIPDVDAGPVILQAAVPVLLGDTPETLAKRVLVEEHRIYPLAIRWFAEGRLALRDGRALLDGKPCPEQRP